jgi:hypothetical protein
MFPSKTSLPFSPFWQQSAPLLLCICFSPRHLSQSLPLGYVIHLPLSSIGDYWIFSFILFQRMNQVQRTVKCVLRFTKKKKQALFLFHYFPLLEKWVNICFFLLEISMISYFHSNYGVYWFLCRQVLLTHCLVFPIPII